VGRVRHIYIGPSKLVDEQKMKEWAERICVEEPVLIHYHAFSTGIDSTPQFAKVHCELENIQSLIPSIWTAGGFDELNTKHLYYPYKEKETEDGKV
jgi:hypothetical protein